MVLNHFIVTLLFLAKFILQGAVHQKIVNSEC